ncbi:MAG: hypothetical protein GXP31_12705 [Kiritimatiellaeota bacterium]|nr:hypothetical protein [Kiritimatiellota bacterium]
MTTKNCTQRDCRVFFRSVLSVFAFACFGLTAASGTGRVLLAEDFANSAPGKTLPPGIKDNSGWAGAAPELSVVRTGHPQRGRALRVRVPGFAQIVLGRVPIQSGRSYRIDVGVRALGQPGIELFLRRDGTPYTVFLGQTVRVNEAWRDVTFTSLSRFDYPRALLMLICRAPTTLWIDHFRVSEVDETPGPQPVPFEGNMLFNSGFELGLRGWMHRGDVALDTDSAHSGRCSLGVHGKVLLSTTWHPVGIGRRYTVSAWVRTEGGPASVELSVSNWVHMGGGGVAGRVRREVAPGRWRRVVLDWKAAIPSGLTGEVPHFYVNVRFIGGAAVRGWIDDLAFAAGAPRPYAPRRPLELALTCSAPYSVFTTVEPVRLNVSARGSPMPREIDLVRFDENGVEAGRRRVRLDASGKTEVDCGRLPSGYWRFATDAGLPAEQVCEGERLVSVVPGMPAIPAGEGWFLGGHVPATPAALAACRRIGLHWDRLHDTLADTKWDHVQPAPERWVFRDDGIAAIRQADYAILGSLDRLPGWVIHASKRGTHTSTMRYPTSDMTAWENYVRRTVAHWKASIHWWEVTNEPNGYRGKTPVRPPARFYGLLLKAAARAARKVDPTARIVGLGGVSIGGNDEWLEDAFADGALGVCDAVAYHGYGTGSWTAAVEPEQLIRRVKAWRAIMRRHGKEKPVWDTETGIQLRTASHKYRLPVGAPPELGAMLLPKMIAAARAAGVEHLFLYSAHEISHAGSLGLNFLLDFDGQMKAVGVPIAVAESLLEGRRFVSLGRPAPGVIRVEFQGRGARVIMLWSTSNPSALVVPELRRPGAHLVSCFGRPLSSPGPSKPVMIGQAPMYVVVPVS